MKSRCTVAASSVPSECMIARVSRNASGTSDSGRPRNERKMNRPGSGRANSSTKSQLPRSMNMSISSLVTCRMPSEYFAIARGLKKGSRSLRKSRCTDASACKGRIGTAPGLTGMVVVGTVLKRSPSVKPSSTSACLLNVQKPSFALLCATGQRCRSSFATS